MAGHIREPENLSLEHVLAFCYLYFGKATDGMLDEHELQTIAVRVGEWLGQSDDSVVVRKAIADANVWYMSCSQQERDHAIRYFVKRFNEVLQLHHREAIISDLFAIASADGTISENEVRLINSLAEELQVNFRVDGPGSSS